MEGTCNECVFPLTKDETERANICPTVTSLTYAAKVGKLSCVKELIAAGADVNAQCECHRRGARLGSVVRRQDGCMKKFFSAGADVHSTCTSYGTGALIGATSRGRVECLKLLIAAGADVNVKDNDGNTALMYASDTRCTTELITAGADVNMRDNKGHTALMHSVMEGNVDCMMVILSAGADVNASNKHKMSSLDYRSNRR